MSRFAIDESQLLAHIEQLAKVGGNENAGVNRGSFSPSFVEARNLVALWCADSGLHVAIDAVGNLIARTDSAPSARSIVVGSHLDSVENGGTLDGAYGVLGGLAALDAIGRARFPLALPVVLAGFVNEEGTGGTTAMTGSRAITGRIDASAFDEIDNSGYSVGDLVQSIGGDPQHFKSAAMSIDSIAAYLELHIEQGPVLERRGDRVGIVTAITGRTLIDIVIVGIPMHVGTTPMEGRRDALVVGAHLILCVERLGTSGGVRVARTGHIDVISGSRNTVPSEVRLYIEIRDDQLDAMERCVEQLRNEAAEIAEICDVRIELVTRGVQPPCATDSNIRKEILQATQRLGLKSSELSSGAGHDAQSFLGIAPIGMIFVPSIGGISHSPRESTAAGDLIAGVAVLAHTIVATAARLANSGLS